jgi:hypothetical protein
MFLTSAQILERSKFVTRRVGWLQAKPGDLLQPVLKGMGLRPGEKIQRLGNPILLIDVRREPLNDMTHFPDYGKEECALEGFPDMHPEEFVAMFRDSHKGCHGHTIVTRIQFTYTEEPQP